MFNNIMGIDLGTASVLIYMKGKGIVLREPSVVAFNKHTKTVIAVGEEAEKMVGKTPPDIETIRPLRNGVISSYTMTEAMIKAFLGRVMKKAVGSVKMMMCVPSGITDVEQRAVIETARQAGAKEIYIIEEPIAAALGAGMDISKAYGTMVIDIGGGTTDIAVISLGRVVHGRSMKIAGDDFNDAVERFIRKEYNMSIGPQTVEYLKRSIGSVTERAEDTTAVVRGISTITGLPRKIMISSEELRPAFDELVHNIIERARDVLEETESRLQGDILKNGIALTGGGSLIYGLDERIYEALGVKAYYPEDVEACVAKGAGIALGYMESDDTDIFKRFYRKAYIHD